MIVLGHTLRYPAEWVFLPFLCAQLRFCFFFLQFIDGRLDLLNSGEGFSDVFEEEINMGEYAGEKHFIFPSVLWAAVWD